MKSVLFADVLQLVVRVGHLVFGTHAHAFVAPHGPVTVMKLLNTSELSTTSARARESGSNC